jgi:hypothetical protein
VVTVVLVVVTLGKAHILLIVLVGPSLHHIAEFHGSLGVVGPEVTVDVLCGEAILEPVDDILVGNFSDGGAHLEEMSGV